MNREKIQIIDNPLVLQNLAIMRDKDSSSHRVRIAAREITRCLLYEAARNLPLKEKEIETPLQTFRAKTIDPDARIIISPILRAGLIFTDEATDILPQACIRHIGMYRDEETLKPVWYYNKIPAIACPENTYVYVTDPMLATGNSIVAALSLFVEKGVPIKNIRVVAFMAAPEGIENIQKQYPEIEIITSAVDDGLNDKGYILPGMGDAGDRIFNT